MNPFRKKEYISLKTNKQASIEMRSCQLMKSRWSAVLCGPWFFIYMDLVNFFLPSSFLKFL